MDEARDTALRTRVELGVLGPLSARVDGSELNLGGRRQRAVIAVLVLARGQQVGTGRLLDALWEGTPPPSGAASLQSYVSHLRRALEPDRPARTPSRLLVTRGDGYVHAPRRGRRRRLEVRGPGGRGCRPSPTPVSATRLLREALGLWRGPVLAEYAGADWADAEAHRLEEIRDVARERLLQARLDAGESAIVVPEAEALLAEAPLREERWRLLTLAQYRSHRQADALATLRRARTTLAEELGVDPGTALRDLEQQVLAQSPDLDAPAPAARAHRRRSGRAGPAAAHRPACADAGRPGGRDRTAARVPAVGARRGCGAGRHRGARRHRQDEPARPGPRRGARRRRHRAERSRQPAGAGVRLRGGAAAVRPGAGRAGGPHGPADRRCARGQSGLRRHRLGRRGVRHGVCDAARAVLADQQPRRPRARGDHHRRRAVVRRRLAALPGLPGAPARGPAAAGGGDLADR